MQEILIWVLNYAFEGVRRHHMASDDDKLFANALRQVFWPTFLIGLLFIVVLVALSNRHTPLGKNQKNPQTAIQGSKL